MSDLLIKIDGREVKARAGATILEADQSVGIAFRSSVTTRNWKRTAVAASIRLEWILH